MDDTGKPEQPDLRLVAENTEVDKARRWATDQVSWALRDMTANLLRIVRGAGKPYEIVRQTDELVQALVAYQRAVGHWPPSHELADILSIDRNEEWRSQLKSSELSRLYAEERIVRGALQKAASRLIGQTTQERAGESEIYDGLRDLDAARAEHRREMDAARMPVRRVAKRRPKTSKPDGE